MTASLAAMLTAIAAALVGWALIGLTSRSKEDLRVSDAQESPHNPHALVDSQASDLLRRLLGPSLRAEGIDPDSWIPFSGNGVLLRRCSELLLERTRDHVVTGGDRLAALIRDTDVLPIEAASLMDVICTSALGGTPLAGHVEEALGWADAGLVRKPDHRPLQATRAGLLVLSGRVSEGVPILQSFLAHAPPEQRGWVFGLLALGLHRLGRAPDAEACWTEAETIVAADSASPDHIELAAALARWRMLAASPG